MPKKNCTVITQDGNTASVDPQKINSTSEKSHGSLDNINSNHNTSVWNHFIVNDEIRTQNLFLQK